MSTSQSHCGGIAGVQSRSHSGRDRSDVLTHVVFQAAEDVAAAAGNGHEVGLFHGARKD